MADLDFLDEGQPSNDPVLPVETAAPVVETPVVETPAEPVVETPPAPAPVETPERPEPGFVPITALMDERDKRKDLAAKLARYEQAAQAPRAPDPISDPEGFQAHLGSQFQQQLVDTKLNMSEMAARRHFGAEKVEAAKAWALARFEKQPAFQAEVLNQTDPYDYAVQQYERDTIASSVTTDDFAQFQAWKAAQAQLAPATTAQAAPQSADPPRSIASQPNSGGVSHVPIDEMAGFNGLFE